LTEHNTYTDIFPVSEKRTYAEGDLILKKNKDQYKKFLLYR